MADDRQWALAWAKFEAMYKNIPTPVTEVHVRDFHEILDLLQRASGEDLASFRVSDSRLKPRMTSFSYVTGQKEPVNDSRLRKSTFADADGRGARLFR
jgi:hypothetical protein